MGALMAGPAFGQTWQGTTSDWGTNTNWNPNTVPNSAAATATFNGGGSSSVTFGAPGSTTQFTVGAIQITGSTAYNFTLTPGVTGEQKFTIAGTGIGATQVPTFDVGFNGTLTFTNSASAGNASIFAGKPDLSLDDASVSFLGSSDAGNSTIHISDSTVVFGGQSSAKNATITLDTGGVLGFGSAAGDTETAGNSSITASGSGLVDFAFGTAGNATINLSGVSTQLDFRGTSSAGNATINAAAGTFVAFGVNSTGTATAGNSTINIGPGANLTINFGANGGNATINLTGSTMNVSNNSSLGNATVTQTGVSSITTFRDTSDAGNSTINVNGGEVVFADNSSAKAATMIDGGAVFFQGNSTAGTAQITDAGSVRFDDSTSALNSTIIVNQVANAPLSTDLIFARSATAADATIIANGGFITFGQNTVGANTLVATAGNANITLNSGAELDFVEGSTADHSTIAVSGGTLVFENTGSGGGGGIGGNGGNAQVTVSANGVVSFENNASAGNANFTLNSGAMTFSNTASGGTGAVFTVNAGNLTFADNTSLGGSTINVTGGSVLFQDTATAGTGHIALTGGSLAFAGSATAGSASITDPGGTTVFHGTADAGTSTLTISNGSLTFFDTSSVNAATATANAGGTITLQDNSTAANGTLIASGGQVSFVGNASLGNAKLVTSGAGVLSLTGLNAASFGARSLSNAGTTSLGGKTLMLSGNFVQGPSGSLLVNLTNSGGGEIKAAGSSSLAGSLVISAPVQSFAIGSVFPIVTAAGGVTGSLTPALIPGSALQFEPLVKPNEFDVVVEEEEDFQSGQIYPAMLLARRDALLGFLSGMQDQLGATAGTAPQTASLAALATPSGQPITYWGRAQGRFDTVNAQGDAFAVHGTSAGGIAGADYRPDAATSLGAALAYNHDDLGVDQLNETGSLDTGAMGLYGEERWGALFLDGSAALSYDALQTRRPVIFGLGSGVAEGSADGIAGGGSASLGWRIAADAQTLLEPNATLSYVHQHQGHVSETNGGGADLLVNGADFDSLQSRLGLRVRQSIPLAGGSLEPIVQAGWVHEYLDTLPQAVETFAAVPTPFTQSSASASRNAGVFAADIGYAPQPGMRLYLRYEGTYSNRETDHAVSAGFRMTW